MNGDWTEGGWGGGGQNLLYQAASLLPLEVQSPCHASAPPEGAPLVLRTASRREIQRAFMNFHPDKGAVVTPAQFHHKALAYQYLRKHRQALGTWAEEGQSPQAP